MNRKFESSLPTRDTLEKALLAHAPGGEGTEPHLRAVIDDATRQTGGMLRPRLAFAAGRAAGLGEEQAEKIACALEFFHIASLLLDDLPCMDDAAMRRGRPCAHRVHGEATAILAALAFINRAHGLIAVAIAAQTGERRLAATALVDASLGAGGLLDGQARDLRFAGTPGGAPVVTRIAQRKTASLFVLSLCLSAIAGRSKPAFWSGLRRLGLYWGLAYQAADDLADVLVASEDEGKTTGRDERRGRPNLALAIGADAARRRLDRLVRLAGRSAVRLAAEDRRWRFLLAAQKFLVARSRVDARRAAA